MLRKFYLGASIASYLNLQEFSRGGVRLLLSLINEGIFCCSTCCNRSASGSQIIIQFISIYSSSSSPSPSSSLCFSITSAGLGLGTGLLNFCLEAHAVLHSHSHNATASLCLSLFLHTLTFSSFSPLCQYFCHLLPQLSCSLLLPLFTPQHLSSSPRNCHLIVRSMHGWLFSNNLPFPWFAFSFFFL